jgi:hypothetical protein
MTLLIVVNCVLLFGALLMSLSLAVRMKKTELGIPLTTGWSRLTSLTLLILWTCWWFTLLLFIAKLSGA